MINYNHNGNDKIKIALTQQQLLYLFSAEAVNQRSQLLLQNCLNGKTQFVIDWSKLEGVVDEVIAVAEEQHVTSELPLHSRWRHFVINQANRAAPLFQNQNFKTIKDQVKSQFDLAIVSVLLDAGAGDAWHYYDKITQQYFTRSEGLAVALLEMFLQGFFSSNPQQPLQVEAKRLAEMTLSEFIAALQVSQKNPLVGLEGRFLLLKNLAKVLLSNSQKFSGARPGDLVDSITKQFEGVVSAVSLLQTVLLAFSEVWPSQLIAKIIDTDDQAEIHLGDMWQYPLTEKNKGAMPFADLIPFHKLSIWLTYSLIEPLQLANIKVTDIDQLPGLAEYRNGGLFIDSGFLVAKNPNDLLIKHCPSDPFIIEWRALTLALLSHLAIRIRYQLNLSERELPIAKVLQVGTWCAGRKLAFKKREDGGSPILIESDATIF